MKGALDITPTFAKYIHTLRTTEATPAVACVTQRISFSFGDGSHRSPARNGLAGNERLNNAA